MHVEPVAFAQGGAGVSRDTAPEIIFRSVAETQQILGLSRVVVYRMIARGRLRAVKAGAKTLIEVASIKEYAASLPRFVGTTGIRAA